MVRLLHVYILKTQPVLKVSCLSILGPFLLNDPSVNPRKTSLTHSHHMSMNLRIFRMRICFTGYDSLLPRQEGCGRGLRGYPVYCSPSPGFQTGRTLASLLVDGPASRPCNTIHYST